MANPNLPEAGEIWSAVLDPIVGHEQGGSGRVVIVSIDSFNLLPHELCFVVPITTRDRGLITQIRLPASTDGLNVDSVAMCDQMRTISLLRLRRRHGQVDELTLRRVQAIVAKINGH